MADIVKIKTFYRKLIEKKSLFSYAGITLLIIFLLFWVNYYFTQHTYGGEDFLINWQATRSLVFKGINPYSSEALQQYSKTVADNNILPFERKLHFSNPLFSLILYLPFSLFSNYTFARAAWLVYQEISAILTGILIIKIFKWDLPLKQIVVLCSFSLIFFFTILNLVSSTVLITMNLVLIAVIFLLIRERYEIAGILFSILTIQFRVFLFPILALLIYVIWKKAWSFFIWFVISLFFMIAISLLFIPEWPLQFIKELLKYSQYANLQFPGEALRSWLPSINRNIGNLIFMIVLLWTVVEFTLTNSTTANIYWTFSLSLTLNQIAWFRSDLNGLVVLLFPIFFIFHQWYIKDIQIGVSIIISSIIIFSIGILIYSIMSGAITLQEPYPFSIYLICPMFLLLNLYWMRWWIINGQIIEI